MALNILVIVGSVRKDRIGIRPARYLHQLCAPPVGTRPRWLIRSNTACHCWTGCIKSFRPAKHPKRSNGRLR